MNKGFAQIWLLLAVFTTFFQSGHGIRCYYCTSLRDPKCADPLSTDMRPIECTQEVVTQTMAEISYAVRGRPQLGESYSGNPITCIKISSQYNINSPNLTYVRGCSFEKDDGRDICSSIRAKIVDQRNLPFCATCTGDACNGSNRLGSNVSLLTALTPLIAFYAFFH